jgi:hypothetical protein
MQEIYFESCSHAFVFTKQIQKFHFDAGVLFSVKSGYMRAGILFHGFAWHTVFSYLYVPVTFGYEIQELKDNFRLIHSICCTTNFRWAVVLLTVHI